ncbi:hypothetical protein CORC01_11503 [Colletotrichum orchidophilum]|uniref:Uncharacterized protein n=1 Tax=Colletotrichum orchidophilum TaxID=1209926 RepID=A0A1G4AVR1_9PEZI|nr:uncharacterized protein CORC01_11503 [Colletotrichum orchidophilum]OHE93186.1 hypothetical protein CORC01_11503 [Colletotrichum orchidophilum]
MNNTTADTSCLAEGREAQNLTGKNSVRTLRMQVLITSYVSSFADGQVPSEACWNSLLSLKQALEKLSHHFSKAEFHTIPTEVVVQPYAASMLPGEPHLLDLCSLRNRAVGAIHRPAHPCVKCCIQARSLNR